MRSRKRRRTKLMVPVASMGDIAFLLIIFFMLCTNFAKEAGINVVPPRSVDIDTVEESTISVSIDENGTIRLNGKQVKNAEAVEQGVGALLTDKQQQAQKLVMFKCDRGADKSVFEPVLEAISKAGGVIVAVGEKGD